MASGLSLHINADQVVVDTKKKERLVKHWQVVKPKIVILKGGERLTEVVAWGKELMAAFPDTRWELRVWPDDGNHLKDEYKNPGTWYQEHKWYLEAGFAVNADNESLGSGSTPDEVAAYVNWTEQVIRFAGPHAHKIDYGRFSAGNPPEWAYPLLLPMFRAASQYMTGVGVNAEHLMWWGPNEYRDQIDGGSGSINRYKLAWDACRGEGIPLPQTFIGELGIAIGYRAHDGYKSAGISETRFASHMTKDTYGVWYQPYGVPVCLFAYPEWKSFGYGETTLKAIENYTAKFPDPIEVVVPRPNPIPVDINPGVEDTRWTPATAQKIGHVSAIVHASPSHKSKELTRLHITAPYQVHTIRRDELTASEKTRAQDGDRWWLPIKMQDNTIGWIRDDVVTMLIPDNRPTPPMEGARAILLRQVKILKAVGESVKAQQIALDAISQSVMADILMLEMQLESMPVE